MPNQDGKTMETEKKKRQSLKELLSTTDHNIVISQLPDNGWVFARENIDEYYPDFDLYDDDFLADFDEIENIDNNIAFNLRGIVGGAVAQTPDIADEDAEYLEDDNTEFRAYWDGEYFVAIPVSAAKYFDSPNNAMEGKKMKLKDALANSLNCNAIVGGVGQGSAPARLANTSDLITSDLNMSEYSQCDAPDCAQDMLEEAISDLPAKTQAEFRQSTYVWFCKVNANGYIDYIAI